MALCSYGIYLKKWRLGRLQSFVRPVDRPVDAMFRQLVLMVSVDRVPFSLADYDVRDICRVVYIPGLTGSPSRLL